MPDEESEEYIDKMNGFSTVPKEKPDTVTIPCHHIDMTEERFTVSVGEPPFVPMPKFLVFEFAGKKVEYKMQ